MVKAQKNHKKGTEKKHGAGLGWGTVLGALAAGVLLLIANSAIWVNNVLFNTEAFTQTTTSALLSDSSRTAIAGEVVSKALEGRPVAQRVVAQPATKFVAGLLDTSLAQTATEKLVSRLQTAVTTEQPESIEFDLTAIKNIATKLIALSGNENESLQQRQIPDTLVLFDASNVPNVYSYARIFLWLAPLALFGGVVLLAYPHIRRKALTMKVFLLQGAVVICVWLMAQAIGPLFRPPVLASVPNSNLRVVVENVYNSFIQTFNSQTNWLFALGCVFLLIPLLSQFATRYVLPFVATRLRRS